MNAEFSSKVLKKSEALNLHPRREKEFFMKTRSSANNQTVRCFFTTTWDDHFGDAGSILSRRSFYSSSTVSTSQALCPARGAVSARTVSDPSWPCHKSSMAVRMRLAPTPVSRCVCFFYLAIIRQQEAQLRLQALESLYPAQKAAQTIQVGQ